MSVLQKKLCMLGAVGVGKTSLVRRFVESLFSERYQATVGVKIDRKVVTVGPDTLNLMLWDLQGEAEHQAARLEYLRGSAGYLVVADATRRATLEVAHSLVARAGDLLPGIPWLLVVNKTDLAAEAQVTAGDLATLRAEGWTVYETSARTGAGVDETFGELARRLLAAHAPAAEA
ncbi:MAG: GTP-binding protein [Gemmatimonadales bacterium]|nr:GTP-binding protein [Gemmatimonadales bacterium]